MPNRIAVTTALTLALAIGSGTVALATTLTGAPGPVGTAAAVSLDRPVATPPAAPALAFDPQAVALLAFADRMAHNAPTASGAPVTASGGGDPTAASTPSSQAPVSGTRGGDDEAAPTAGPGPVAAPPTTTTTNAPPFDCRGSDDGLSEAVKHARETYCHGGGDD